ncbi:hypothetical protein LTR37_021481 [Vermiconidia calcicola]|uniref:Uncharacterized protein n=1 Tax=Vermiconidia calcicola TaxID=1690605 RepID=A0ACC3M8S5_9PEZI|nr:hypothetical protein LTR37_021481 [Vermiconidia calcicola]
MALYRSMNFAYCSRYRRRKILFRALGLALVMTTIYVVLLAIATPFESEFQGHRRMSRSNATFGETSTRDVEITHLGAEQNSLGRLLSPTDHPTAYGGRDKHANGPACEEPAKDVNATVDREPDFDATMRRISSLALDKIRIRELLRPFEEGGEANLRDLGLRTRAFKAYFEIWESLHLCSAGGTLQKREDVVQRLRNRRSTFSSLTETIHRYDAFRHFFSRFASLLFPWIMPYFPDHMSLHTSFYNGGRGIVLTAGDNQAPYILTSIPSFRGLGCTLPIEILYLGDEDLSEEWRIELEALSGVVTRDLSQMVDDQGWKLAGWAAKPFAILMSSFREVLFLDADALFFVNPETLFEDDQYLDTGALFFKDRLIMPEMKKNWLQKVLPRPFSEHLRHNRFWTGESGHMQESGVVVVDKWKHFVALLLVTRMNGPDRDGNAEHGKVGVYDMIYGDKETFWLGWELAGDLDYAFHQGNAGIMGALQSYGEENAQPGLQSTIARSC